MYYKLIQQVVEELLLDVFEILRNGNGGGLRPESNVLEKMRKCPPGTCSPNVSKVSFG